ncbi:olfactory receptor 5G26-like [Eleutherodactylus coqui]|uniref:olfactory receptor 5G26-like n=1 Tax=Eleutherodactylus coqui TaxID=57060 RepID=UPI0034633A63
MASQALAQSSCSWPRSSQLLHKLDNREVEIMNQTIIVTFYMTGLSTDHYVQLLLFVLFLIIYVCCFACNICMMLLIRMMLHLHTPMYFFLSHLSFVDLCFSSSITPRMLADFTSSTKSIPSIACATQMFCFSLFAATESLLVSAMAYDRYVAICRPLVYHGIMNKTMCRGLAAGAYVCSFLASITITSLVFPLCGSYTIINHFYCDIPPLLKRSCGHSRIRRYAVIAMTRGIGSACFLVILLSYVYILRTILGIQSKEGRSKAFSTCASHLTVVITFYTTALGNYFRPSTGLNADDIGKVFSIFYTVTPPLLNPLIYSFKNTEVKIAVVKVLNLDKAFMSFLISINFMNCPIDNSSGSKEWLYKISCLYDIGKLENEIRVDHLESKTSEITSSNNKLIDAHYKLEEDSEALKCKIADLEDRNR